MTAAAACFAAMNALIRQLATDLPALEIVFFRNFAGLAFMLPWLIRHGPSALRTNHHRLYLGRSAIGFASMVMWFTALTMMPLAEATALSFTAPLFATLAAAVLLHETVRLRRWTATVVGFLGAMIVLRPGFDTVGIAQILVLGSTATAGINAVMVKQLTRTEPASAIVTYMTLYIVPLSLVPALFVWVMPPLHSLPWIILLGLFATLGHQAMTRAFAATDTSVIMPFDFARLPFVAVIAWFAFGEAPDIWTWVGAAVIVAATAYIAQREAAIARAELKTPPSPVAPAAANEGAAAVSATGPEEQPEIEIPAPARSAKKSVGDD
ncbi:MAG: DMT family transporter [Rhodospirillales bacterium]|nr:DMT family transporter [Rhodospirillales bacterium]